MIKTNITKEKLIEDGWVEPSDKNIQMVIALEKLIENRNPINDDPEDTDIRLILHSFYNEYQFAIIFPDGGMLNFVANYTTTERILVFIDPRKNNIPRMISEKYGGNWIIVGELKYGSTLKFNSSDDYFGFDDRKDDNYCQGALEENVFS